jgi:hypothetical protein
MVVVRSILHFVHWPGCYQLRHKQLMEIEGTVLIRAGSHAYGGTKLVLKPVCRDSSEIYHCLLLISVRISMFTI